MCNIFKHEKITLPTGSFEGELYIWGHSFQFGANLCGKNLYSIF